MIQLPYLSKPLWRSACNGCGLCCSISLCDVAEALFPAATAPCPALELEDGRYWCGLVRHPAQYLTHLNLKMKPADVNRTLSDVFEAAIGTGLGCSMEDDAELVLQFTKP